jgi:hypothetical protein
MTYYSYIYVCAMIDKYERLVAESTKFQERVYRKEQLKHFNSLRESFLNQ